MSEVVYNGFHFVEKLEVDVKGKKRVIERLGVKNAVAAIVTDAVGKIGLVKQYRPCVEEVLYEIPAGLMDKAGLSAKEILIEELEEECEVKKSDISFISEEPVRTYYMLCGSSDAKISIYRIKLSSEEVSREVKDVDVESVEWIDFSIFEDLVQQGKITDAKTLMSYYILKDEGLV